MCFFEHAQKINYELRIFGLPNEILRKSKVSLYQKIIAKLIYNIV